MSLDLPHFAAKARYQYSMLLRASSVLIKSRTEVKAEAEDVVIDWTLPTNRHNHHSMAKQTTVTITDDLDGSTNAKEVSFSLNGKTWTIDLSAKNHAALEKALKPYIAKATEQGRSNRRGKGRSATRSKSRGDLGAVREWAKSNGHQVSDRGRISANVLKAYDAAH